MDSTLRKTIVTSVDTKSLPIIATLQNGIFNNVTNVSAKRVEHEETGRKFALIATPDSVYKSDITDAGSSSVNTFLAIRNKRTNKMQLIQVQEASFKHTIYDNKRSIFENNVVDAKKVLHKEFGGKKALANYERIKRTAPNLEVLEDNLEKQLNALDDSMFEKDIFDQTQEDRELLRKSIFPELDFTGNSARDILDVKKILGNDMMEHLAEVAIQVLKTKPKNLDFVNNYLNSVVRAVQISKMPDSAENVQRVALLVYVDALVRLINCRRKTLEKTVLSNLSDYVDRDVRKKFQENFTNSKFTRQKSIIYYLVLVLISTETLEVEIESLLESVDITKTELLKYAAVVGAKVKNKTILQLQRPKMAIDLKVNKKRRKK